MKHRARETIADVLEPLLDFVAEITKSHATLLIGAPPPKDSGSTKFWVKGIYSGTTKGGKPWSLADPEKYDVAVKSFLNYLTKTDREFSLPSPCSAR